VDVRIGISQTPKELEIELDEDRTRAEILEKLSEDLATDGVMTLTDKHGKTILVPVKKIAYVEVGASTAGRRVGFGNS
jgi:hypothetical protein